MEYEETSNGKDKKLYKRKDLKVKINDKKETRKPKMTLTVFTYLNFKRFGVSVALDDGLKINILWFETHIKFDKI